MSAWQIIVVTAASVHLFYLLLLALLWFWERGEQQEEPTDRHIDEFLEEVLREDT